MAAMAAMASAEATFAGGGAAASSGGGGGGRRGEAVTGAAH